ncbi:MAG: endonuclease III domain-containing protein [Halanaerobiales bacterium]
MYPCNKYKNKNLNKTFTDIYNTLYSEYGPQGWWPADSQFETIIGAILTQSVSWTNVEKAIDNLKDCSNNMGRENVTPDMIRSLEIEKLAQLIRPSGYYNMKAKKLKAFVDFLFQEYQGDLDSMFSEKLEVLRLKLLEVYGVGPETADSILLYAGNYPIFVIDAYTKRIFSRMGLVKENVDYHDLQNLIMENLLQDVERYNEYHALLVELAKNTCKKTNPDCDNCVLVN